MAGASRSGPSGRINHSMRPPLVRPSTARSRSVTPALNGRISPANALSSSTGIASAAPSPTLHPGGAKRREREIEREGLEETNINVVVRCRGRSDREVKENSGVIVSLDGIKGRSVELKMGPTALSNKVYNFDKVFSPAADQAMLFEDVVVPILGEVLSGFNCTIFAYGQTGTGKTYTMSGDISDVQPLPDAAGVIPRVLHYLFAKLENDDTENFIKCSFIELYNEELRDLLAPDENVKLKLFEDGTRKGNGATMVQGMEESHIASASRGIQLLREGSHKRQVAATKCNDLSSRSHTVFTVTVYKKTVSETGEELVSAGKLNLVDLAGSENIQRSGAENKRAAEAGLINKSLLTLGRVINALVDKGTHIPYRESKLTRLLQDSLGGRTKTCIIATLSPAKSNLEETISTLDYAFRAKNIRNKPQFSHLVSKKTLLREFTTEIEKLKYELVTTRQRNGVYLAADNYEQIITESESRRILNDEQRDKIETMEANLRNKVQELFSLTSSFNSLKKEDEALRAILEGTKSLLEKTEAVLQHTRQSYEEEAVVAKAHEKTEESLAKIGNQMIETLDQTTSDISGLNSKLRRRSNLHAMNRDNWATSQGKVAEASHVIDQKLESLRKFQSSLIHTVSEKVDDFVQEELRRLEESQNLIAGKLDSFESTEEKMNEQTSKNMGNMNDIIGDAASMREAVKSNLGAGLRDLTAAAERISTGVLVELDTFQTELHSSYSALAKDFKTTFDSLVKELDEQKADAAQLQRDITEANDKLLIANAETQNKLRKVVEHERKSAAEGRQELMSQIGALIDANAKAQELRLSSTLRYVADECATADSNHGSAQNAYSDGMKAWCEKSGGIVDTITQLRDNAKAKIQKDFATASTRTDSLRTTTAAVHDETVRIVDAQMAHMNTEMQALDGIITRLRRENSANHDSHVASLSQLGVAAKQSFSYVNEEFTALSDRMIELKADMAEHIAPLQESVAELRPEGEARTTVESLREDIEAQNIVDYNPTGETPQRHTYLFPKILPRTEGRDMLIARLRGAKPSNASDNGRNVARSPTKGIVFADNTEVEEERGVSPTSSEDSPLVCLRELDVNVLSGTRDLTSGEVTEVVSKPSLKRQNTVSSSIDASHLPAKRSARLAGKGLDLAVDGRENR